MEKELEDRKSETSKDDREHEKMIFSLVFNGKNDTAKIQEEAGNGCGNLQIAQAPKNQKQSKKKLNLVKKIAKVINPLIYVLFVIFYFIYFIMFFSQ